MRSPLRVLLGDEAGLEGPDALLQALDEEILLVFVEETVVGAHGLDDGVGGDGGVAGAFEELFKDVYVPAIPSVIETAGLGMAVKRRAGEARLLDELARAGPLDELLLDRHAFAVATDSTAPSVVRQACRLLILLRLRLLLALCLLRLTLGRLGLTLWLIDGASGPARGPVGGTVIIYHIVF